MLDYSQNVTDFLQEIPHRTDGKILITAILICIIFFALNLSTQIATQIGLGHSTNWAISWLLWPVVLFAMYLRIRSIYTTNNENRALTIYFFISLIGSDIYFALNNWNLL